MRLPDNAAWHKNDNKMRQDKTRERTEWPFKVTKILRAEGGSCCQSKLLKIAKKAKLNHPKPPVMLRVLRKQPWVTLVGTEGEKCDWTLALNKTEIPRKRIRRGGSKETRKQKKKARPKKKKAPKAEEAPPGEKRARKKGSKGSKKKGGVAKKTAKSAKGASPAPAASAPTKAKKSKKSAK